MYEELLIGLRGHAKRLGCDDRCPCYDAEDRGYATCSEELAEKAADAIEELDNLLNLYRQGKIRRPNNDLPTSAKRGGGMNT